MEYLTGFMIEKSLSMDNVFVMAMIFTYLAIPRMYQHRVLSWDILGVIVLRAIMIGLGATLVSQFSWIVYVFGVFLVGIIGKIPPAFSLSVTSGLIAGGVLVSPYKTRGQSAPMAIETK